MKKSAEERVERVLAGLRDAEAPAGMERRILERVRERAAFEPVSDRHSSRQWLSAVLPGRVWAVAGVMVICVAAYVTAFRMEPAGVKSAKATNAANAANTVNTANTAKSKGQTVAASALPQIAAGVVADNAQSLPTGTGRHARVERISEEAVVVRGGEADAVAWSEMRAASHPAPELPLTEEEKLLVRIVRRGDPQQLAMLDPVKLAARDAEEKAEFQSFFAPAKTEEPATGQATAEESVTDESVADESTTGPTAPSTAEPATAEQSTAEQANTGDIE